MFCSPVAWKLKATLGVLTTWGWNFGARALSLPPQAALSDASASSTRTRRVGTRMATSSVSELGSAPLPQHRWRARMEVASGGPRGDWEAGPQLLDTMEVMGCDEWPDCIATFRWIVALQGAWHGMDRGEAERDNVV